MIFVCAAHHGRENALELGVVFGGNQRLNRRSKLDALVLRVKHFRKTYFEVTPVLRDNEHR
jgi:hypothetical protein